MLALFLRIWTILVRTGLAVADTHKQWNQTTDTADEDEPQHVTALAHIVQATNPSSQRRDEESKADEAQYHRTSHENGVVTFCLRKNFLISAQILISHCLDFCDFRKFPLHEQRHQESGNAGEQIEPPKFRAASTAVECGILRQTSLYSFFYGLINKKILLSIQFLDKKSLDFFYYSLYLKIILYYFFPQIYINCKHSPTFSQKMQNDYYQCAIAHR